MHMDPGLQRGHWPFVMGWLSLAEINSLEKESVQREEHGRTRKRVSKRGIFWLLQAEINSLEKERVQDGEQGRTRKRVSKGGIFDYLRQRLTV